jgi:hypothetical protein
MLSANFPRNFVSTSEEAMVGSSVKGVSGGMISPIRICGFGLGFGFCFSTVLALI